MCSNPGCASKWKENGKFRHKGCNQMDPQNTPGLSSDLGSRPFIQTLIDNNEDL